MAIFLKSKITQTFSDGFSFVIPNAVIGVLKNDSLLDIDVLV